ncbi:MAG: hypothetical protein PHI34_15090 [Acidobacteriota bacterium]|nr:hypothetical protein [Acidobacteriota bacterium]
MRDLTSIPRALLWVLLAILASWASAATTRSQARSSITFDNQSGETALVKLQGPSAVTVNVPRGSSRTVAVQPGQYQVLLRFGDGSSDYRYEKGDPFEVSETARIYSHISITLYKVASGNYSTRPIDLREFESAKAERSDLANPHPTDPPSLPKPAAQEDKTTDPPSLPKPAAQEDKTTDPQLRSRAEQGDADAQNSLGEAYADSLPPMAGDVQAVAWYRKAAEQGHAQAQLNLGLMYSMGRGVPQDDVQGALWWRKAAEQGEAAAQLNLGQAYASGEGVPQDYVQAASWWRKSAEQGEAAAQLNLGQAYASGEGVPQDDVQAVAWYRKAAQQGAWQAQYELGLRYAAGQGVVRDDVEAYKWLSLAVLRASEAPWAGPVYADEVKAKYAKTRDAIAENMTPAQIAEAQQRANAWAVAFVKRQKK